MSKLATGPPSSHEGGGGGGGGGGDSRSNMLGSGNGPILKDTFSRKSCP